MRTSCKKMENLHDAEEKFSIAEKALDIAREAFYRKGHDKNRCPYCLEDLAKMHEEKAAEIRREIEEIKR
jgi:uncharacterized protein with PIN domain